MKNKKRVFVWLPQWNVYAIEAWLSNTLKEGWELSSIKGRRAIFIRTSELIQYYCHIFDYGINNDSETNVEEFKSKIEEIEKLGFVYISSFGNVVFSGAILNC